MTTHTLSSLLNTLVHLLSLIHIHRSQVTGQQVYVEKCVFSATSPVYWKVRMLWWQVDVFERLATSSCQAVDCVVI